MRSLTGATLYADCFYLSSSINYRIRSCQPPFQMPWLRVVAFSRLSTNTMTQNSYCFTISYFVRAKALKLMVERVTNPKQSRQKPRISFCMTYHNIGNDFGGYLLPRFHDFFHAIHNCKIVDRRT